jgi:hypothetical protein
MIKQFKYYPTFNSKECWDCFKIRTDILQKMTYKEFSVLLCAKLPNQNLKSMDVQYRYYML